MLAHARQAVMYTSIGTVVGGGPFPSLTDQVATHSLPLYHISRLQDEELV